MQIQSAMSQINIFIAFMLPKRENTEFSQLAGNVRATFHPEGKDEKFFHTTLLFIGRVDDSWLPFIQKHLAEIAASQAPIPIDINHLGYFYNRKKNCIKVIYAMPDSIPEELQNLCTRLYEIIGKPLYGKTVPAITPSTIHFTISKRLKNRLSEDDFQLLSRQTKPFSIRVNINAMGLYYCKDPDHRYYREICRYNFQQDSKR